MIASVINALFVAVGSAVGLLFKNRIHESSSRYIMVGLGLCVFAIGVDSMLKSEDTLCVIICMVLGILLGEALRIEDHLDQLGETLKKRFSGKENSRFTEGFMTATLLFCVGSMAIVGSLEAGINGNYSIILSKSVIDCVTAVTFAAAMGVGVVFSAFTVLIYQGLITLLAIWVGPFLPEAVILEMSGVGGLLIVGLSINMLGLMGENRVRVGNMLPAVFLPIAYVPFVDWLSGVIG